MSCRWVEGREFFRVCGELVGRFVWRGNGAEEFGGGGKVEFSVDGEGVVAVRSQGKGLIMAANGKGRSRGKTMKQRGSEEEREREEGKKEGKQRKPWNVPATLHHQ